MGGKPAAGYLIRRRDERQGGGEGVGVAVCSRPLASLWKKKTRSEIRHALRSSETKFVDKEIESSRLGLSWAVALIA